MYDVNVASYATCLMKRFFVTSVYKDLTKLLVTFRMRLFTKIFYLEI